MNKTFEFTWSVVYYTLLRTVVLDAFSVASLLISSFSLFFMVLRATGAPLSTVTLGLQYPYEAVFHSLADAVMSVIHAVLGFQIELKPIQKDALALWFGLCGVYRRSEALYFNYPGHEQVSSFAGLLFYRYVDPQKKKGELRYGEMQVIPGRRESRNIFFQWLVAVPLLVTFMPIWYMRALFSRTLGFWASPPDYLPRPIIVTSKNLHFRDIVVVSFAVTSFCVLLLLAINMSTL